MQLPVDINCDMGESYGRFQIGNDAALFPYLTSCNIACGFHGGDPLHIEHTIRQALAYGLRIGAHPSYPDLMGFGRRRMELSAEELRALIKYQLAALKGMVESEGGRLSYVKPHGALYNSIAGREDEARTVIAAIQAIDPTLSLMGLAGSPIQQLAAELGISFIAEAFADRRYDADGYLVSRSIPGAVIEDPDQAAEQVAGIVRQGHIRSMDGKRITIEADSICIHGDNPAAVDILKAIHRKLTSD